MKSSTAGDDDDSLVVRDPTTDRICDYCGKRFGSGKALGGHMRIHERVRRRSESEVGERAYEKLPSSDESVSCRICGKKFESWKSVFGHMRTHPDRGMQRKISGESSSASFSSTVSENHHQMHNSSATVDVETNPATDLTKYLSFWSATGRRGRKDTRTAVVTFSEPRSRLFKKKMRKLSDLEDNHRQEIDASKQVSYGCRQCYVSFPSYRDLDGHVSKHIRQLHGGSLSEIESATTNSSVTSSIKIDVIMYKNSDHKEILTTCREDLHDPAEHSVRKLLQIDLNELPPIEENEGKGIY